MDSDFKVEKLRERDFKNLLRKRLCCWTEALEPRRGSGVGIADLLVLINGQFRLVEVKVGRIQNGVLKCSEIRPVQISWLDRLYRQGGSPRLIVGVKEGTHWGAYCLRDCSAGSLRKWKVGWPVENLQPVMSRSQMLTSFTLL